MGLRFGLLFLVALAATRLTAKEYYREDLLYSYDRALDKWVLIAHPESLGLLTLYGRWDNELEDWVWVTKDNRDRIVDGSKVEGWRLGYTGKNYLNWFKYCHTCKVRWSKCTDRVRPAIYRYSAKLAAAGSASDGIYRSYVAHEDWASFGGEVDPLPPPPSEAPPATQPPPVKPPPVEPPPTKPPGAGELTCQLEASPLTVKVNEAILVTMTTTGPVVSAHLDGIAVDFPRVVRGISYETSGTYTIKGSVLGRPPLVGECAVTVKVLP